jgi:hypothetical protein
MRTENPCFKTRAGVNGNLSAVDNLRLELNQKSFCLLPYHHLEFVKFESDAGQDTLTLLFLNRAVCVTGKNLRELGLALQDRCVEFIKPLPERYAPLVGDEVSVKAIEIQQDEKGNGHA